MSTNNRFTRLDSGVIHDSQQGLEIYPDSKLCRNWQEAHDYCAGLGDDWRMPTVDELASLVDRSRAKPACDPMLNMPWSDWHWSSSPVVGWPAGAWCVYFNSGGVSSDPRNFSGFVRPVRVARPRQ